MGWWSIAATGSLGSRRAPVGVLVGVLLASGIMGCGVARVPPPAEKAAANPTSAEPDGVYLVLKLGERRLYLMNDGAHPPDSFPVAIGTAKYPTPTGRFAVREMVENPDWMVFDFKNPSRTMGRIPPGPKNPMGLRWIAFASAHGWEVGFHGTPKPELLGQAVSHGCVRMHNRDVVKVYDKIKLGTPVIVEP